MPTQPPERPEELEARLQAALEAYRIAEEALERGISEIRTPEQAEKILDDLEQAAQNLCEADVQDALPPQTAQERAAAIQHAVDLAPAEAKPKAAIAETATQLAAAPLEDRAFLDEAVGQATGGEGRRPGRDFPPGNVRHGRRLLRRALFHRLRPLAAVDALLFIQVNHLPHPKPIDGFMTRFSWIMTGGVGWISFIVAGLMVNQRAGTRAALGVLPALWLSTSVVEWPVKSFFRRRRPFISLVRAIVVGRKPGSYSFPSGHSAAAFGGAALLSCHYPRGRSLFYTIAGLVGFSRVYLGAHYPGDVLTGAVIGTFLSRCFRRLLYGIVRRLH